MRSSIDPTSFSTSFKELITSITALIRSEIHLAKTEVKVSTKNFVRSLSKFGAAAALGVAGLGTFIAFLVIGLGELLDGRFWLSALIVSIVFLVPAGFLAYSAYKNLISGVSLETTQNNLKQDQALASHAVDKLTHQDNVTPLRTAENSVETEAVIFEKRVS